VRHPRLWLLVGIVLIVAIASLNLFAMFGPAYIMGNVTAPCCSSPTIANLPAGMRLYVTEIQKNTHLDTSSIFLRFAFKTACSIGLLVLAVFLAFRKRWAWKGLFAVIAVSLLGFLVLLAGAVLSDPHSVTLRWLSDSVPLDSVLLYGGVLFIFLRPAVRALYMHGDEQPGRSFTE
jgi:hypothetical protein